MSYRPQKKRAPRSRNCQPWLAAAGCIAWMLAPALACSQKLLARAPLTAPQIVAAMQDRQLPTAGVEVRLAVPITSSVATPALEIQAASPLNQYDVRVRVACVDRSECLPFFATATYPEPVSPAAFQLKAVSAAAGRNNTQPEAKPVASTSGTTTPASSFHSVGAAVLRSGSPATLDFDGDRIHVRLEVICLESGATGDTIHVTTRDHKQTYLAEIVAPRALRGTLTQ